jgi:PAS domain S-box-containing protein
MEERKRKSGIDILGDVPWGTHLCQFYQTKGDLVDILVPYFKAGLENNEFCMWVTSEPLRAEEAEKSLRKAVKDLDKYIKRDQIEIMDYSQWYTKSGKFAADKVFRGWANKENEAVKKGYDGLRLAGNTFWLEEKDWRDWTGYEVAINNVIGKYRILAVCPYSLDKCGASEVIDVVNSHQFALIRREGKWEIIESSERKKAETALKEKEEFNFTLFQYNPIQTIIVDNEGKVIKTNLAKKISGDRLPNIGDVMYRDYAGKHEIDMRAELMECLKSGRTKNFPELKYRNKFLSISIAPFPQGAIITSQDITERKRVQEESKRRNEELATLNAIAATVSSSLNLQEILDRALDKILEVAGVEVGSIYLLDQQAKELVLATYRGVPKKFADQVRTFKMGESLTGRVAQSGKPIVADDLTKDHRVTTTVVSAEGIHSMACLPIKSKDKVIGAINLASHKYHRFSPEEIRLYVGVANQIGVAIENGWLHQKVKQELAERKKSEEEYRTVVRTAMDGFWVLDTQGRFLDVSGVYSRLIGYSRDELLKMRIQDIEAVETAEETGQRIQRMLATGGDHFETRHRCKDGKIIDVEVSINYLKEAGGRFFVFLRDITERHRAEEALRESEEKYRTLVERANDGIVIIQDNLIKYVNPRGLEILENLGYTIQEIMGTPFTNYIQPDEVQRILSYYARRMKGKKVPTKYESVIKNREGKNVLIEINASMISYQGKAADMAIFRDVTERKKAEQELKESEEKYRTLTHNVNVSMFRTSPGPKGRFIEVNPEILKMFGFNSKKEFFKLNVSDFHQDPEGRKKFNEKMLRDGFVKNEELKLKKKDGTPIICSVSAVAVKDEKGSVMYFDGVIEDITERKRVEEEIKESREQIRNFAAHLGSVREQERTVIAREIHDELGQSLTALKMDLSWLYKKMPRDKALLPKRTKSMLGLVDATIQSVKRISSELRPGLLDDIGVSAAIEWQCGEFQNHTGIKCEVNVGPEDIILDQERSIAIFRIFQEALTNVARHAKATRVKASLKKKGGKLELKVRDNGRGITEEKISDPKSFGFVGMKERAHFLDGTVEIRGIRDKGTLITVRIPLPEKGKNDKNPHRG